MKIKNFNFQPKYAIYGENVKMRNFLFAQNKFFKLEFIHFFTRYIFYRYCSQKYYSKSKVLSFLTKIFEIYRKKVIMGNCLLKRILQRIHTFFDKINIVCFDFKKPIIKNQRFNYLKNLKIFPWKKWRFRLRWDSSPGLSIAGRYAKYRDDLNVKKLPIVYLSVSFHLIRDDLNWEKLPIVCLSLWFHLITNDLNWEKLPIVCLSLRFHLIPFYSKNNRLRAKMYKTLKIDLFIGYNFCRKYFFPRSIFIVRKWKKLLKNIFF